MKHIMVELIIQSLPAVALSLFGDFVATFTRPNPHLSVRMFIGGLLAAALVGLVIDMAFNIAGGDDRLRVITVSIGGYCARDALDILARKFLGKLRKVDIDD